MSNQKHERVRLRGLFFVLKLLPMSQLNSHDPIMGDGGKIV